MKGIRVALKKYLFPSLTIFLTIGFVALFVLGMSDGWIKRAVKNTINDLKGVQASVNPYYAVSEADDKDVRIVSGVLRNSGEGWQLIEDRSHSSLNCNSVYSVDSAGFITVDYSGINAKSVISFIAVPDESFAKDGYSCGASVGLEYSNIYLYRNIDGINEEVEASELVSETGNFWFIGIFEV